MCPRILEDGVTSHISLVSVLSGAGVVAMLTPKTG